MKIRSKQKNLILKKRQEDIDKNVYLYLDHYIKKFPAKLKETVKTKDTDEYGTLLPQDIVQYIINADFDGVSVG